MNIYLDMDGVGVDFAGAIFKDTGYKHVGPNYRLPKEITKFYREQGTSWWTNLEPYPWFDNLLDIMGTVTLLTSAPTGAAYEGKMSWASKNGLGIIVTNHKHLVGNGILIDDYESNINMWQGPCILFPQPWNRTRRLCDDRLGYVTKRMKEITTCV